MLEKLAKSMLRFVLETASNTAFGAVRRARLVAIMECPDARKMVPGVVVSG